MAKRAVKRTKTTKTTKDTPSLLLQGLFIGASVMLLVMQIIQTGYYISLQVPDNANFSAYFSWLSGLFVIVGVWLALYATRRKRTPVLHTVFDVTLVTISASMLVMAISWLSFMMPLSYNDENFYWLSTLQIALPWVVVLPLLIIVIRRLRATKQW